MTLLVLAFTTSACGDDDPTFAEEAVAYVPAVVADEPVVAEQPFAQELGGSILEGEDATVATGTIGAPEAGEPLPDAVLLVYRGNEDAMKNVEAKLRATFVAERDELAATTVAGTRIESGEFRQGDLSASPRSPRAPRRRRVVAFAFEGGPEAAASSRRPQSSPAVSDAASRRVPARYRLVNSDIATR